MRYLPFAMTRGPLLSQLMRESGEDTRRFRPCGCCGARMSILPDRVDQVVRCPACLQRQRIADSDETPWRLTTASAEALRRTKSWARWLA